MEFQVPDWKTEVDDINIYTPSHKMYQLIAWVLGIKHLALTCVRLIVHTIITTPTLVIMDTLEHNLILYLSRRTRQE